MLVKDTHQPFFPIAARDIFMGILVVIMKDYISKKTNAPSEVGINKPSNVDLKNYLMNFKVEEVEKQFREIPELSWLALYLEKNAKAMSQSIRAMMNQVTQTVFNEEFLRKGDFSIKDFVSNRRAQTLFIEYDISTADMFVPIYRTLFDLAIKEVLSRKTKQGNVYFIIDEFRLLPYLQFMDNAVNFGREKGLRMIVGLQSVEQLYSVYEEPRARNILSGFSTMVSFRPNDYHTRAYVSERSGKNFTMTKYSTGYEKSMSFPREGFCVEDWELTRLNKGQALVINPDVDPFMFNFPNF
jgi:type IV secretory pathway TraG/TraD family ATPase VirD4